MVEIVYISLSLWSELYLVESHSRGALIWEDVHYLNVTEI